MSAYAAVKKVGRWTYRVSIFDGLTQYGPDHGYGWHVLGRARAEAKARRELARYLRPRDRDTFYVHPENAPGWCIPAHEIPPPVVVPAGEFDGWTPTDYDG